MRCLWSPYYAPVRSGIDVDKLSPLRWCPNVLDVIAGAVRRFCRSVGHVLGDKVSFGLCKKIKLNFFPS